MRTFHKNIDQQLKFNQGKNLFHTKIIDSLKFSQQTLDAIGKMETIDAASKITLIDYITNSVIGEFCRINQYYTFDKEAKELLRKLYSNLFDKIKTGHILMPLITQQHYEGLIQWLKQTNPSAESIYTAEGTVVIPVACSEYTADLQTEILQIDIRKLQEPVLDIGCGKEGNLVFHLREKGIEAFGFDRFAGENTELFLADWMEYSYEKNQWGTIISNLGFSNHFRHHHLKNDGNFLDYAKKYMEILNALQIGGTFHYAPDLPFIELYLDSNKYKVTHQDIGEHGFRSSKIRRLK